MKSTRRIGLPAAIALLLGAFAAESFAKREVALGIQVRARATQAVNAGEPVDPARVAASARDHLRASTTLAVLGLAMAASGVGSWFVSLRRGEAGPRWLPPALLVLDILWLFMFV